LSMELSLRQRHAFIAELVRQLLSEKTTSQATELKLILLRAWEKDVPDWQFETLFHHRFLNESMSGSENREVESQLRQLLHSLFCTSRDDDFRKWAMKIVVDRSFGNVHCNAFPADRLKDCLSQGLLSDAVLLNDIFALFSREAHESSLGILRELLSSG